MKLRERINLWLGKRRWIRRWLYRDEQDPTEFGRGLLVCLLSFFDHHIQIQQWFELTELPTTMPEPMRVQMWANGASDHLYELHVPKFLKGTDLARRIEKFRDKWLEIGHGFTGAEAMVEGKDGIKKDLFECKQLALEVAAEMDKLLGLDARVGQWS